MIYKLSKALAFPDPHQGEEDGLFAVGGDLSIDRLLLAYSNGIFPWFAFRQKMILWYCPMQRFVIFPPEIHVSHSMRTLMNKGKYHFSFNRAFSEVIHQCSVVDGRYDMEGAWLGEDIIKAYTKLYEQGFAASVEIWEEEKLVGGLYGVTIGRCFFGESMFSLIPSGSKLALISLARFMEDRGGSLIDCQFETPHLKSMGGRFISYEDYMEILNQD